MDKERLALKYLPKYDQTGTWRTFALEFSMWLESYDAYGCGDDFMKKALIKCFKGNALTMITNHHPGTATYNQQYP